MILDGRMQTYRTMQSAEEVKYYVTPQNNKNELGVINPVTYARQTCVRKTQ
jgi:hypothetical protein